MTRARILIADDHTLVAQALAHYLGDEFDLLGVVSDGAELVDAVRRLRPDVVISDVSMPGMGGVEALRRLNSDGSDVKVILLTMYRDGDFNQPVPVTFLYGRAQSGKPYGWLARANVGER